MLPYPCPLEAGRDRDAVRGRRAHPTTHRKLILMGIIDGFIIGAIVFAAGGLGAALASGLALAIERAIR